MKTKAPVSIISATAIYLVATGLVLAAPSIGGVWDPATGPGPGRPSAGEIALTSEGRAEFESFSRERDPTLQCILPGVPLAKCRLRIYNR